MAILKFKYACLTKALSSIIRSGVQQIPLDFVNHVILCLAAVAVIVDQFPRPVSCFVHRADKNRINLVIRNVSRPSKPFVLEVVGLASLAISFRMVRVRKYMKSPCDETA